MCLTTKSRLKIHLQFALARKMSHSCKRGRKVRKQLPETYPAGTEKHGQHGGVGETPGFNHTQYELKE